VAGSILIPTNAGFATGGLLAGVFHIKRNGSFYMHSLTSMALFPLTLLVLAFISTAHSPWSLYVLMVFFNGLLAGAALNYALVHLLHLTLPEVHPIVLSLLATFRGFAGSFGSAIGGGLFGRVLRKSLTDGFAEAGLTDRSDLVRRLLGSPALVQTLHGKEKDIAVQAYEEGLRALFYGAVGLGVIVACFQAATGRTAPTKSTKQVSQEEDMEGEEALVGGT
jgi:MFS family permease